MAALADKRRFRINIEVPETRQAVWQELAQALPHANVGWSARKEQAYLQNPQTLAQS